MRKKTEPLTGYIRQLCRDSQQVMKRIHDGGNRRPDPAKALMCLRRAKGWSFPGEAGTPSPGPPSQVYRESRWLNVGTE